MKSLLLGSASVAAVVLGLAGSANAQAIDIGDLVGGAGALLDAVTPVVAVDDISVSALVGIADLPVTAIANGIDANVAVNVAPQVAIAAPVALGVDTAAVNTLVGSLAVAVAASPNTISGAAAFDPSAVIAAIGGGIDADNISTTAVGQIVNQASQRGTTSFEDLAASSVTFTNFGTVVSTDEATQAAAQNGALASSSAARYAATASTGAFQAVTDAVDRVAFSGAAIGVSSINLAANVAPQISAAIPVGSSIIAADVTATAVGQIANQINSVGLDAAGLAGQVIGGDE